MTDPDTVVIIGAGQAGQQVAASLRTEHFDGRIVLIHDEPGLPYQRPPLSKAYLGGSSAGDEQVLLRRLSFYAKHRIELLHGHAESVNRREKIIVLDDGRAVRYAHLVLALGSRSRPISVPGCGWQGVLSLRTRAQADMLRKALASTPRVVIIGAGVIGLEVAATARTKYGCTVTVVEPLERPMSRMLSAPMADFVRAEHERHGVTFRFGTGPLAFNGSEVGAVTSVITSDGNRIEADLVLVAIGVQPEVRLAQRAGLATANGIVVNEYLSTEDPDISAIGDCVNFPSVFGAGHIRLECVQNAVDHGRAVAKRLAGQPVPYTTVPWFWSDQFNFKIQIAGEGSHDDAVVLRPDSGSGFSVLRFRESNLVAVESVDRPADHLAARKLLGAGIRIGRADVERPGFELKSAMPRAAV